ncbi:hypothetical protein BDR26DRAFT_894336 [Obelidium mucronatum]|nr:hypothetical protein BDR26DRAFT_894336 [Obelidium mucronatum]
MDTSSPILIHMVVIWSFLAIIFYFLTVALLLANSEHKSGSQLDQYVKIWQSRLNFAVGTGGLVDSDVLRDVAGELAYYFKDFDWAPSDIAVALLLLKREQKKITEIRQARRLLIEQPMGFAIPTLDDNKDIEALAKVQGEEESRRMTFMNSGNSVRKYLDAARSMSRKMSLKTLDASAPAGPSIAIQTATPIIEADEADDEGETNPKDSGKSVLAEKGLGIMSSEPSEFVDLDATASDVVGGPVRKFDQTLAMPIKDADDEQSPTTKGTTPSKLKGKFSVAGLRSPNFKSPSLSTALTPNRSKPHQHQHHHHHHHHHQPQFRPFQFRKRKQMGSHRREDIKQGTVFREEIDDILYFARYAEVVYTPEEVNMIYSDRLHFHSTENGIYRCPYLIVHDEGTDSIVIAIRGTYSAADVLVDLKFDVTPLLIPELDADGEEHLAHGGFMTTAKNILADLKRLNILEPLLNDKSSEFYGCSLVVTGHSLGAGVAALLANMLRYDFPSTCCYTFEPPGCIVSRRAAEHFELFCTSVVMGDDVVTRLSRNTMEMLKLDIDRHLKSCDEPKWKVFGSVLGDRLLCCGNSRNSTSARKRGARASRPGILQRRTPSGHLFPEDLAKLKRRTNSLRAGKKGEDNYFAGKELPTPPMYIPGKILHIEKLRRPPLNMNQMMGRQLKKVVGATKAVGEGLVDLVFEGAEKIKDGVEDIGDLILDGADFVRDGAEGIKDKIVPPKSSHQSRGNGGGPSGGNPSGIQEDVVVVPLKDSEALSQITPSPVKRRAGSMGDLFETKSGKSKSSDNGKASANAAAPAIAVNSDEQVAAGESDDLAEAAANAMEKGKVSFIRGVSMAEGTSSRGDRGERQSRRRRRKLERARSAGNIRSKSAGRDGFISNAEETEASSSEDETGIRVSRFRSRRSRTKKESGAVTDTEVFSDTELADLGGTRHKDKPVYQKPVAKQTLAGLLGGPENARRMSEQAALRGAKFPRINTSVSNSSGLLGRKSAEGINQRFSSSPTRMRGQADQVNPSIMPRAHVEAVPSDSITGKVVPVGSAILESGIPGSPTSPLGNPQPISPFHITHESLTIPEPTKGVTVSAPDLNNIEEEDVDDDLVIPTTPGVRFQEPNPSVVSHDDYALSKPQYPPAQLNAKEKGKGPVPQGPKVHGKYHYVPRWARKEEFQEIIVSRSMIVDHSPFELLREFQAAPAGSVLGVVTRN